MDLVSAEILKNVFGTNYWAKHLNISMIPDFHFTSKDRKPSCNNSTAHLKNDNHDATFPPYKERTITMIHDFHYAF